MRSVLLILISVAVLVSGCVTFTGQAGSDTAAGNTQVQFDTSHGAFTVELFEERAPNTTANVVSLVEDGFYDETKFHRVIDGFMIQGGDPLTRNDSLQAYWGTGGPGYTIDDEFHPELRHDRPGILSMANSGPDTGGSQFFITVAETPWLDGRHAVFGEVVEGYAVVEEISQVETDHADRPVEHVVVHNVTIVY